jgi:hypothetical protein
MEFKEEGEEEWGEEEIFNQPDTENILAFQ